MQPAHIPDNVKAFKAVLRETGTTLKAFYSDGIFLFLLF